MAAIDLTTLASAKVYLSKTDNANDAEISALITQVSQAMRNDVSRDLVPVKTYTRNLDGNDKCVMYLPDDPIIAVNALSINGKAVPAAPFPATAAYQSGYIAAADRVELVGYEFCKGIRNINIVYQSGFAELNEQVTIPATPFQVTAAQPEGNFNSDLGVSFVGGAALVPVASGPTTGQYSVSAAGQYTFAAADVGKQVYLNYGFVPADLERACIEWVAQRFLEKTRIGVDSKTTGGETTRYTKEVMPDTVLLTLEQYRRVAPLW